MSVLPSPRKTGMNDLLLNSASDVDLWNLYWLSLQATGITAEASSAALI